MEKKTDIINSPSSQAKKIKFNYYQAVEGHPDMDECQSEAQLLAEEIKPIILKDSDLTLKQRISSINRKSKGFKSLAENFVINRKRYKSGNHALKPPYTVWTMLNPCNFRCSYCDNHEGVSYYNLKDKSRLDTEKGKQLLKIMRTGGPGIYWCGGEPTIRKDLPELLDYACNLGYYPNIINTNGSLLHTKLKEDSWKKFLWQMDVVIISLDGLNKNMLNNLWGVDKAKQVITNILLMKELQKVVKFKIILNTVILPETIEEAKAVLDFSNDLGVWFVPVPVNFKEKADQNLLENKKYIELANLILTRKKEGHKIIGSEQFLDMLLFNKPYQCINTLKTHVWSDGTLTWPCRSSVNVEPVKLNVMEYNTMDEVFDAGRKLVNPDNFHGPAKNQCGANCSWAQNYVTARYAFGLLHPFRSGIFKEMYDFKSE